MTRVLDTVRQTIKRHRLLADSSLVLVAVSGGSDSVFLLRALHTLKDEFGISLRAAHLNHMLRGAEAEKDAEWVRDLCRELAIKCIVGSSDVRSYSSQKRRSLEESARECRYEFLENLRSEFGADTVALGHTMEDQAETLLLRLFRGAGATGLSAMAMRRGFLIRPLLRLRRHEIKEYLDQNGFGYLDDPTNLDLTFTRNLMRHRVIPSLESQLSTSLVPILARTASVLAEEDAFLEETAERDLEDIATLTEDGIRLEFGAVDRLDEARKRRVLRAAVRKMKGDLRGIGYVHIDALYQLLCSGSTGSRIDIPSMQAYRDYDHLLLSRSSAVSNTSYARTLKVPGVTFVQEVNLRLLSSICSPAEGEIDYSQRNKAYFDLDQLTLPISVRSRRPGDRFVPFAAIGSRKLKEVFIDDKVSRRLRDSTPIVVDSEGILWIPCGRRSDRAPVTGTTERILCIEARRDSD